MTNTIADLDLPALDMGPDNNTKLLHSVGNRYVNASNIHLLKREEYYCLRARFDGCWAGVLIGETEQEVRDKMPEVMALLPGATFEFGHNKKSPNYEDDFAWHETLLPL